MNQNFNTFKIILHKIEILMQNYLTFAQNHVFLGYILSFFCSHKFSAHIFIFVCLCCFSLRACFHVLRLLSQMLRLEFHVISSGSSVLHWSTSSRLTGSSSANQSKRGGDVTPVRLISCRCSVFCSLVQVKMDYCQLGNIFPYRTLLYVSVCHCCTPAWRSVTLNEPS